MKIMRIEDMKSGWFVGNFIPTAYQTSDFEVNYRVHAANEIWDMHFHTHTTEINLVVSGRMKFQEQELVAGDIFIIEPWEISNPVFLEDTAIICVRTPSMNDKVCIELKS